MSKTDSSGTTTYKRAGAGVTSSLLKSTVSSTTTDYTPGVSSRVSGDSTFMHSGIKNADEQTDASGDIAASRQYDAFGSPISSSGTWAGPFGYGGPYGYQTGVDHGLMLLGHRYYEADTGRFLTRDPIKDGRNWYGYCGSQPITCSDPEGLQAFSPSFVEGMNRHFGVRRNGDASEFWKSMDREATQTLPGVWGGQYRLIKGLIVGDDALVREGLLDLLLEIVPGLFRGVPVRTYTVVLWRYPKAGGFGLQLFIDGKHSGWRLDFHRWARQPWFKWVHYHRPPRRGLAGSPGESSKRHRPWEGW